MEVLHIHYSVQETECHKVSRDPWVITQHEQPKTTGEVIEAHCTLSSTVSVPLYLLSLPASICAGRQVPHRHHEIVSQLWRCQATSDGCTVLLQTEWQTVWALPCHCGTWLRTAMTKGRKGFHKLQPPRDCCGRNAAAGGMTAVGCLCVRVCGRGWGMGV